MLYTRKKYAQLLAYAEIDWSPATGTSVYVSAEATPIERLTSAHFNLVQANAEGFTHLFLWFPAINPFRDADEARLLQRAGVVLHSPTISYG